MNNFNPTPNFWNWNNPWGGNDASCNWTPSGWHNGTTPWNYSGGFNNNWNNNWFNGFNGWNNNWFNGFNNWNQGWTPWNNQFSNPGAWAWNPSWNWQGFNGYNTPAFNGYNGFFNGFTGNFQNENSQNTTPSQGGAWGFPQDQAGCTENKRNVA